MAKSNKNTGPAARLPKGFLDLGPDDIRARDRMLATIREVFERYGFEPLETPAIEYTDALGKFLPDQDRPNEGVFSFQDVVPEARTEANPEQWLSLRYDLTAPLARYVAEGLKEQKLALPFRRYAVGPVWRNEKPGPGRFRQFTQFDADTVGTDNIAADAEICMLAADTMEALGIKRGQYLIKFSSRKVLDGLMEAIGLGGDENAGRRLSVLRAIDKLDRLGVGGVRLLLGPGRKDDSGDFTVGAGLTPDAINKILDVVGGESGAWTSVKDPRFLPTADETLRKGKDLFAHRGDEGKAAWDFFPDQDELIRIWLKHLDGSQQGVSGLMELSTMIGHLRECGYGSNRVVLSSSVVRGLEYYTGPVFEAEITIPVVNEDGQTVRFGSVGGGGRYDGLVERFLGQEVPATGFSIGVSRLQAALAAINKDKPAASEGPVVVLVMEKDRLADYQKMAQSLRTAGIRAEMYLGTAGMKAQMKYADKRGAPCVVIQGGDERAKGEVQIKDLIEGAKAAATIKDSKEWREGRPAQVSVPEANLVAAVRDLLARHKG
jgi:histidyl-tRNA synthetase